MIRSKKRKARDILHSQLLKTRLTNPREFWKIMTENGGKKAEDLPLSVNILAEHFFKLHSTESNISFTTPGDWIYDDLLDDDICEEEIKAAIRRLKPNTSPGLDGLPPTLFKLFHGNDTIITFLNTLFNTVLEHGIFPTSWASGYIKPLYKGGRKTDPQNYRGITILPVLGKIFTSIINERLQYWCDIHNLLPDSQFGFRKSRSTADPIFITTTLLELYKKRNAPLFTAFIDLEKAFDSINRNLLWTKLHQVGVSTKILILLQSIYEKSSSVIKVKNDISTSFPYQRGVRQGCPLSPLLFSLFLSDLDSFMTVHNNCKGVRLLEQTVNSLMFADDLVIFSDTNKDLQHSLSVLEAYCSSWDLRVNATKSKVLIFNASRHQSATAYQFNINNMQLEIVSKFKYLGIIFSDNGTFNTAVSTLAGQAKKVLFTMRTQTAKLRYPPPILLTHIFNVLVVPILEYGCEIWGWMSCPELEKIHRQFCKFVLNVPISATNLGVYGELGRFPLNVKRYTRVIKFWSKLTKCKDWSPLLYDCYTIQRFESLRWARNVQNILNKSGVPYWWDTPIPTDTHLAEKEVHQVLCDQFLQEWSSLLEQTTGKLRTFKLCKTDFRREKYLDLPPHLRSAVTKLRLSCHPLYIETGRYHKPHAVPVEERTCIFCKDNAIENETHFLFQCIAYKGLPEYKLFTTTFPLTTYKHLTSEEKWRILWIKAKENSNQMIILAKYIYAAFKLRQNLIMKL